MELIKQYLGIHKAMMLGGRGVIKECDLILNGPHQYHTLPYRPIPGTLRITKNEVMLMEGRDYIIEHAQDGDILILTELPCFNDNIRVMFDGYMRKGDVDPYGTRA